MKSQVEKNLCAQKQAWTSVIERNLGRIRTELPASPPKRIILFGLGSSYFAARLAQNTLSRDAQRLRVPVIATSAMQMGREVQATRGDWVIAISHRAKPGPTRSALARAAGAGAYCVMIAGIGAERCEEAHLMLETVEQEVVEPHTLSMTGAIVAATCLLGGDSMIGAWREAQALPDPELEALKSRAGTGPVAIMGEFEGEWLAKEGALKLMEMARVPVRCFGSEEFHHGPKFSHPKGGGIWHVNVEGDPRASQIDAQVRVEVSPKGVLGWLPALIELQWLALAVALNKGVSPDDVNA